MKAGVLRIGELARATASQRETIRFYERENLLPAPARTGGNYRLYNRAHVERLTFIRHCRALDMSLLDIRALLRLYDSPTEDCAGANSVIDAHIEGVLRRIRELNGLKRQLQQLRGLCKQARPARNCRILSELSAPDVKPAPPAVLRKRLKARNRG